jgi:ubiquinone/menaquinone biosynthesis C-methylase UbiE
MLSRGYKNLYGVDVQQAALDHMSEIFPGLRDTADIRQGTFQAVLPTFADKFFDVVFSHGATIELVPPTFRACKQLARISSKAVVLVVSEFSQAYPRLWEREFLAEGMLLTRLARPCTPGDDSSLMVFERIR